MDPHPQVLSRDNTEKRPALDYMARLLEEAVSFGSHLFAWCLEERPVKQPNLVVGTVLHQFGETLDGAADLVREGLAEPMKIVLRSAFESFLGLHFLLKEETEERVRFYRVSHLRRKLKLVRRLDPATPEGKEYRALLAKDTSGFPRDDESFKDMSREISEVEGALAADEDLRRIRSEWDALRKKRRGSPPPWYALFDGPGNLRELSEELGFAGWYLVFYEDWSATAHAADALARIEIDTTTAEGRIRAFRHPSELQGLTTIGVGMALSIYPELIQRRAPGRLPDFGTWWLSIRELHERVTDLSRPLITFREP